MIPAADPPQQSAKPKRRTSKPAVEE
jgi:hypothetical protein